MRRELKEAIRTIHSDDYQKLLVSERQVKKARRGRIVRRLTGLEKRAPGTAAAPRLRTTLLAGVGVVFLVYLVSAGVYYYNRFSLLVVELNQNQSLVDNEIKRRANLIPNLMVVSAEYSAHEKSLYKYVSEMRTQLANYKGGDPTLAVNKVMSSLLALAEQYPDLKATQSFEQLMGDWTETENRIAEARGAYIHTIREYNGLCTTFPSNIFSVLYGREKYDPFSFEEPDTSLSEVLAFFSAYPSGGLSVVPGTPDGGGTPEKRGEALPPGAQGGGAKTENATGKVVAEKPQEGVRNGRDER